MEFCVTLVANADTIFEFKHILYQQNQQPLDTFCLNEPVTTVLGG